MITRTVAALLSATIAVAPAQAACPAASGEDIRNAYRAWLAADEAKDPAQQMKHYDEARTAWSQALRLNPTDQRTRQGMQALDALQKEASKITPLTISQPSK